MEVRKLESVTTHYSSEVANLNPEDFRNLSIPYDGNSDVEFLNYLWTNIFEFDSMFDEMPDEVADEVYKLIETPQEEVWNSTQRESTEWMESGKVSSDHKKHGDFVTEFSVGQ